MELGYYLIIKRSQYGTKCHWEGEFSLRSQLYRLPGLHLTRSEKLISIRELSKAREIWPWQIPEILALQRTRCLWKCHWHQIRKRCFSLLDINNCGPRSYCTGYLICLTRSQLRSNRTKYPNECISTTYGQTLQGLSNQKSMKKICYSTICSSHACPFNLST